MKFIFILLSAFILIGCGEMKVDGSTQKTYRESIQNMKDNLPVEQSQKMEEAINAILFEEAVKKYDVIGVDVKRYMLVESKDRLPRLLNDKTADEIIKMGTAARLKSECDSKERLIPLIHENISILESTLDIVNGNKAREIQKKIDESNIDLVETEDFIEKNCF